MSGSKSSDGSFARAASLPPEARAEHPLGLTVHTLPEAGEAVATAQRARHGRWKMLGVLLICAAPVVASYFTYYVIRPEGRRVYGELINPQRTVPALTASTLNGAAMRLESLKGQWLLVSVAGGDCDPACQKHLYLQRQLRESLGKEKDLFSAEGVQLSTQPVRFWVGENRLPESYLRKGEQRPSRAIELARPANLTGKPLVRVQIDEVEFR